MIGLRIVRASWIGTGVFAVAAAVAAISGNDATEAVTVAVDLALFAAGCVVFVLAYARAVRRSRQDEISVVGLYFLAGGSAPKAVRRHLMGALAAQTVVAVATASVRPFTGLAFGILVPVWGMGLAGLWAARHGAFPARTPPEPRVRHGRTAPAPPPAEPTPNEHN